MWASGRRRSERSVRRARTDDFFALSCTRAQAVGYRAEGAAAARQAKRTPRSEPERRPATAKRAGTPRQPAKETKSLVLYKIRVLYRRLVIAERLYKTPDFVPEACKTRRSRDRQQAPPDGRTKATREQAEQPNATRRTHETGKPRKGQTRTKRRPTADGAAVKPAKPVI